MFRTRLGAGITIVVAVAGCCGLATTTAAESATSVSVDSSLVYNVAYLTVTGSATCSGGNTAGIAVTNGSLEQMIPGGGGGPLALQLDGSVLVDCDGAAHNWSGHLISPGRVLPNDSGGTLTVDLMQGSTVIASTGAQPVHIVTQ